MLPEIMQELMPYLSLINFTIAAIIVTAVLTWSAHRSMREVPSGVQNLAEYTVEWFVKQTRTIGPGLVSLVAPFAAVLFMLILASNLMSLIPIPILKIPPTAFYAVPFALAVIAVFGGVVLAAIKNGVGPALLHLVWPNPIQLISEISHVLSLSLRLFGNIAGEFMVTLLVAQSAPLGIPLIIHGLALIPACIQPFVFTLLTFSFLGSSLHHEPKPAKAKKSSVRKSPARSRKFLVRRSLRGSTG